MLIRVLRQSILNRTETYKKFNRFYPNERVYQLKLYVFIEEVPDITDTKTIFTDKLSNLFAKVNLKYYELS